MAIGFAFQNNPQNYLGEFSCFARAFPVRDFVRVIGIEGIVSDIQARAPVVTTREGRQVVIPNATIFTSPVAVDRKVATNQGP